MVQVPTISPTGCWLPKRPETCPQARKEKLGKVGSFSLFSLTHLAGNDKDNDVFYATTGCEAGSSQVGQLSNDLSVFLSFAVDCPLEPMSAAVALGGISI